MSYASDVVRTLGLSFKEFDSTTDLETALAANKVSESTLIKIRRPSYTGAQSAVADAQYENWFIVSKEYKDADSDGTSDSVGYYTKRATFEIPTQANAATRPISLTFTPKGTGYSIDANLRIATNPALSIDGDGKLAYTDIQIAAASEGLLSYDAATRTLKLEKLATMEYFITNATSLFQFIDEDSQLVSMQKGDILFIPDADETWLFKGTGSGGVGPIAGTNLSDFIQFETPSLTTAGIRNMISSDAPITYNPTTGKIGLAVATYFNFANNILNLDLTKYAYVDNEGIVDGTYGTATNSSTSPIVMLDYLAAAVKAVRATVPTSYVNGVTNSGGIVKLGGDLTGTTNINLKGNLMTIDNTAGTKVIDFHDAAIDVFQKTTFVSGSFYVVASDGHMIQYVPNVDNNYNLDAIDKGLFI